MHKGEVGTRNLNIVLQKILNKNKFFLKVFGREFRVKDKVMHLKNNYEKEVFNGDIGEICTIDQENQEMIIDYDGRKIIYEKEDLEELTLAYAISVHKSQGSEYSAIVIPLLEQHYPLLQRNLLYTAVTRGKKLVIIVGSKKALEIAIQNTRIAERKTKFKERLKQK